MGRTTYKTAPKAGLYTRLSVDDGITDKESNSITSQKQMLMQYAQYHGIEVVETYVDDGWSGTNFERPDFKRMIEDIESGKINTVITKDLSRLGRDYLQTGYYTEVYFPGKKVRYIAISDGIDTSMGYNEMAPFKNLFNDFYARDISKKIRSTMTTKARAGIYHSTVPPFGYRKSPEDSHKLIPDAETAPIVRRMYELAVQGKGYKAIGNVLKRERIPIPAYWHHIRGERTWAGFQGEGHISNYIWNETTIKWILSHEVYIGSLVAQKQSKLFKVGKNYVKPKDEWVVVKDRFEPIVDLELWERVQEVNGKRRRMCKAKREPSIFSGIAYCPDCGRRISFFPEKSSKNSERNTYFGSCQNYKANGRDGCTPHRIKEQDLYDTVLKDIREWAELALADEQAVLDRVMEQQQINSTVDYSMVEGKKRTIEKRLGEIEKVISRLYEDYALGRLAGTSIDNLMPKYQREQEELKKQLSTLQEQSAEHDATEQNAGKWISLIRQYSDLKEINSCIINELITKILIGDKRKVNGEKVQSIEIHYRFIGNLTDSGNGQFSCKNLLYWVFTDENNDLMGPVDLIEVNESEYIRTEDVHDILEYDSAPRTWEQVIVEDIIVPIAREAIEQLLDIGFQRLDVWMEEKSVPAAKQKAKKAGKDISIFFSAMKSAIKGEQPKALQIIEAEKKKNNNSVQVVDTVDSKQNEKESREKVEITQAEFEQLVALTKRSAVTLVGCINLLKNSAISDMDETQKIKFEKQLKELTTEDLMTEINLLLEDKNKGILDSASYAILSAFRDGEFIIEGKRVPIERCVNNGE